MERILNGEKKNKGIKLGYAIAFLLLIIAYFITFYQNRKLVQQSGRLQYSTIIIDQLEILLSKLKDAETGVRGYLLTKNAVYLASYHGSKQRADSLFDKIKKLKSDNPYHASDITELQKTFDRKFELQKVLLQYFENHNSQLDDSLSSILLVSKNAMDNSRDKVAAMQHKEQQLHADRQTEIKSTFTAINTITITSLSVALVLIVFSYLTYRRENRARKKAIKEVYDYQEELKKRVEELNAANAELIRMRRLEKFAATGRIARTIAHEVRNPLTNINLATDQLKAEVEGEEDNSVFLFEMINRNSNRINQLISDLLTSTKFSELTFDKISVNELLEEALKEAEDRIALTHVKVIKKLNPGLCDVYIDKAKMKIAFLNIIINAIEAMEKSGKQEERLLVVETREEEGKCKIIISDNGEGMDMEAQSRLFEPYFTSKPNGNGLGLTNTQNIILNHQGDIAVSSEKGKGTSFMILLNFAKQQKSYGDIIPRNA